MVQLFSLFSALKSVQCNSNARAYRSDRQRSTAIITSATLPLRQTPVSPLSPCPSVSLERFRYNNVHRDMMDTNSNSYDMYSPKIEIDSETERDFPKREHSVKFKVHWNSENTMKLIETMEKECRELWDVKNPLNKDRSARQSKFEFLADIFGTTAEEISRKVHNLRTQFNNELRKIKRRQVARSGWEYFDSLAFLMRAPSDPLETVDAVNLELAEFQADEEEEFGAAARAHAALINANNSPSRRMHKPLRVAASAPLPLPPSANPLMWPEEPTPRIRPGLNADECQIFGDFVASELRTLRSHESRKRLKRMIQKAILQIGEEEDVNMISG